MAFSHKTFRKCGSHFSELVALDGVEVKVGENFRPPKKITLPVGFHPKDPSDVLSLSYNFSLENEIIAKAEEEEEQKLQFELEEQEKAAALKAQEEKDEMATSVNQSVPISVFSNVGTDILQPIAVTSSTHKRNDSLGKNTFDLSDFEANGTNPFELVELQTINDLDVLKSVLQPVTHSSSIETSRSMAVASAGISTCVTPTSAVGSMAHSSPSSKPFSYLSNQTPISCTDQENDSKINSRLSKSVPDLCNDQLVDISSHENNSQLLPDAGSSTSRSVSPPSSKYAPPPRPPQPNSNMSMGYGMPTQPFNYLHGGLPARNQPASNPVLVDINSQPSTRVSETITPLNLTSSATSNAQMSYPMTGTIATINSHNNRLPPLRKAPPIPPRPANRKNINNIDNIANSFQGMTVTDGAPVSVPPPAVTCSQEAPRIPGNYMTHNSEVSTSTNQSVIRRQPAQKRSKTKTDNTRPHSTPLPPITSPSPSPHISNPAAPKPPSPQSVLPDPMPVLTESEKGLVQYIAAMGFPIPRVARAVQRLGEKDREVVDFLVAVEELCQKGFSGDNAEIAMTFNDYNAKKALEFLNLTKKFKELGFPEPHIHEALNAADNDRDKALDFLTSISAS